MHLTLALALFLAALALPAVASADDTQGTQTEPTQAASTPVDTTPAAGADEPATGSDEPSSADDDAPQHPPVLDLQPPPGDSATEPSAPESTTGAAAGETTPEPPVADETTDTTPTTASASEGSTSGASTEAPAATEPEPSSSTEQTTTIDQGASATAVAEQTGGAAGHGNGNGNGQANGHGNGQGNGQGTGHANGQGNGNGNAFGHGNGAGNVHSDVRVERPGTSAGIAQENQATAQADATATAGVDTGGAATVAQAADASATAVQSEIGNVQVSVRVDSPGDDGDVSQANEATATSSAGTSLETGGTTDESGQATADSTAVQTGVANTVVAVRVFSPGDDGVVRQTNDAGATANADDDASATAVQDGVRNTYVGIRVESPGDRGAVQQSSVADADTTPEGQASVVSDGIDTIVVADITAPDLSLPGETTVWEWTWQWSGDEADLASGTPFVLSGNTWSWSWGDVPEGTVVQRDATTAEVGGTWTWDWSWERDLPGWAWEWRQQATLACATCVWVWRWDWQWIGQPPATTSAPPTGDPPSGAREQSISVTAVAEASAEALVSQVVEQENEGATQFAGQIATIEQIADASALARQRLARAQLPSVVLVDEQGRTLVVTAQATAAASIDQSVGQLGGVAGDGRLDQWSGQQAEVLQAVVANGQGEQELSAMSDGYGVVLADAVTVSGNEQSGVQAGLVGDGKLDQWLGQQIVVAQVAGAAARTTQTLEEIVGATATATSLSVNLSLVGQASAQDAMRDGGIGSQRIGQYAQVVQDALAIATTSQPSDTSSRLATSDAAAFNRSLTLQGAAQSMDGAAFIDLQDISQQISVAQEAFAASTSTGGIGGAARTVNCSTVQQGAGQGIGSSVSIDVVDLTSFCTPPHDPVTGASGSETRASSPGLSSSVVDVVMTVDDEVLAGHGTARYRATPGSIFSLVLTPPPFRTPTESARDAADEVGGRAAALSQVSSPVPSQAGFDSRPKGSAGADTVTGESPLPWTGGPPAWATALADAVAALGGSGIAAILAFLVLTPPLLRRVRDGAVVGRPVSVLAPIDVPI